MMTSGVHIRSLHSRTLPSQGLQLPQCRTFIFPLVCVEPKDTASCGPLHQGVVRWAESGGWFNEGTNVLPRMSDSWSSPYLMLLKDCLLISTIIDQTVDSFPTCWFMAGSVGP